MQDEDLETALRISMDKGAKPMHLFYSLCMLKINQIKIILFFCYTMNANTMRTIVSAISKHYITFSL